MFKKKRSRRINKKSARKKGFQKLSYDGKKEAIKKNKL
jgi:hypothetical protein